MQILSKSPLLKGGLSMKSYVHNVPGRLRVKNPMFKNISVHYEVRKSLVEMGHGIGTAEFNATTGSLLIHYNQTEIHHQDILNALARRGFYYPDKTVTNDQVVHQATSTAFNIVAKAVSGAFLDVALQGTGLSFLAILL